MAVRDFPLPDLGEGLPDAEILTWLVTEGQLVEQNQPVVTVETAKAAVDIPAKWPGRVVRIFHPEGATVAVGTPILSIDTSGAESPTDGPDRTDAPPTGADGTATDDPGGNGRTPVLVGYGPRTGPARRRPRRAATPPTDPAPTDPAPTAPAAPATPAPRPADAGSGAPDRSPGTAGAPHRPDVPDQPRTGPVPAKPPVRKLARDLGVDLRTVPGTGPDGSVTRADVERVATAGTGGPTGVVGDDREERIPIRGVRRYAAEQVTASLFTAPHATVFLTVDVTRGMRALRRLRRQPGWEEARVTPLLLVAKAVLMAVRRHPMVNATWDEPAGEIVVKRYVNLGIAAATDRGLVVPNIKDADRMSLRELADAMTALVKTAKAGRATPAELTGGTFTITNVGVFGVDTGTPILPTGEAAILAFGAVREQPWVHKGSVRPRQVTTLALSFDHRLVDGELASRFLADVGAVLTDPETALLAWG